MSVASIDIKELIKKISKFDTVGVDRLSIYRDIIELTHIINGLTGGLLNGGYTLDTANKLSEEQLVHLFDVTKRTAVGFVSAQLDLQEMIIDIGKEQVHPLMSTIV